VWPVCDCLPMDLVWLDEKLCRPSSEPNYVIPDDKVEKGTTDLGNTIVCS
jgi:hypothetical protein